MKNAKTKQKRTGSMIKWVEHLANMHETLSSISSTANSKKKENKKFSKYLPCKVDKLSFSFFFPKIVPF
jgi:hypothetical protein